MIALLLASVMSAAPADTVKPVKFTADAGLVSTSGNTDITTYNLAEHLLVNTDGWRFDQFFSVIHGETDGEATTALWFGSLRAARDISKKVSFFLLGNYDRNTFAGIESRISPQLGVNVKLVDNDVNKLQTELGATYTWQTSVPPGEDVDFSGARAAVLYQHNFGPKAQFTQILAFFPNFDNSADLRINSESVMTAPITAGIAMRVGYTIKYDGLPEPGYQDSDRILTTGIQLSF
jgi:putative salt-induced outer membrane protein